MTSCWYGSLSDIFGDSRLWHSLRMTLCPTFSVCATFVFVHFQMPDYPSQQRRIQLASSRHFSLHSTHLPLTINYALQANINSTEAWCVILRCVYRVPMLRYTVQMALVPVYRGSRTFWEVVCINWLDFVIMEINVILQTQVKVMM